MKNMMTCTYFRYNLTATCISAILRRLKKVLLSALLVKIYRTYNPSRVGVYTYFTFDHVGGARTSITNVTPRQEQDTLLKSAKLQAKF